jgi:hypothetical protein
MTLTPGTRRLSACIAGDMSLSAETINAVSKSLLTPSSSSETESETSVSFSSYSCHDERHVWQVLDFCWKRPHLMSSMLLWAARAFRYVCWRCSAGGGRCERER